MPDIQLRMTNKIRMTNDEDRMEASLDAYSSFELRHSFVFMVSSSVNFPD